MGFNPLFLAAFLLSEVVLDRSVEFACLNGWPQCVAHHSDLRREKVAKWSWMVNLGEHALVPPSAMVHRGPAVSSKRRPSVAPVTLQIGDVKVNATV
jgi:hypothetical protein